MKKLLFSFVLIICFLQVIQAQSLRKVQLNEKSIVTDSAGNAYPYAVWTQLLANGDGVLKSKPLKEGEEPIYILYKLSEAEKMRRMETRPKPRESAFFKTGEKLKSFKFRDIEGIKYDSKNLTGKVIVLNFWFVNCSPCRKEIPALNKLVESYKDNTDVVFIAIALDDAYSLKQFLKNVPFHYNIVDNGRYLAQSYGVRTYPTHVVVDKSGNILFHTSGLSSNTVYWVGKSVKEALDE